MSIGAMQRDLTSMLQQKSHLAALGLAVSKINHDLRNLLASAQLFSDRLASVPDPNVQRFAPKLMQSLERAIAFCQSTLSYGQVREAPPDRKPVRLEGLVEDVRETLGISVESRVRWITSVERGLIVDADSECFDEAAVCRYVIAGGEKDDVAGHHLLRGDDDCCAVA